MSAAAVTFGLAVPGYKNVDALRRCLLSVARVSPLLSQNCAVVDDSGTGHVWRNLQREHSQIHWIVHENNAGFGASATEAVAACAADIVVLLNDDVELMADPLPHLTRAFANEHLFAATFRSLDEQGRFREGAKRLTWPFGFPRILHNESDQRAPHNGTFPSEYAVGGHAAFHRRRFLELHGFDALFAPFYWEDVDLCLRARQRGWHTIFLPDCVVTHGSAGAIRDANKASYIREMTLRNRFLFAWRHCPPALRPFLQVSTVFQSATSRLFGRTTFPSALRAARERISEYSTISPRNSDR